LISLHVKLSYQNDKNPEITCDDLGVEMRAMRGREGGDEVSEVEIGGVGTMGCGHESYNVIEDSGVVGGVC